MKTTLKLAILSTLLAIYGAAWAIPTPPPPHILPEPTIQKFTCNRVIQTMNAYKTYQVCDMDGVLISYNASTNQVLIANGGLMSYTGTSNGQYFALKNFTGIGYDNSLSKNNDGFIINFDSNIATSVKGNLREGITKIGTVRVTRTIADSGTPIGSSAVLINANMSSFSYYYLMR